MRTASVLLVLLASSLPGRAHAILPGETPLPAAEPLYTLGEHTTEFEVDPAHEGRAHNVALAASRLDGAVIAPGATFSFNETVGPRTLEAGFAPAPELVDGRLRDGVGGGTCQVATTLHVAALRAGLDVVEHRAHSIPLHYAEAGLDATVAYGRIDYRVRNRHPFAVRVRATAEGGMLVVRIEGAQPVAPATIETRLVRRIDAPETCAADASLPAGDRRVLDRGHAGLVVRVRVLRADGTRTDTQVRYSASPRVVRVGA